MNQLSAMHKLEILASIREFEKNDGVALGTITLRLSPTVQQSHQHYLTSAALWNALRNSYGKSTASLVFKDFKDCLNAHISTSTDPNIYFDKAFAAYA
jgi:hypothetical protein